MRISDWSSDVRSSDLNWQALTLGQDVAATRRAQVGNAAWRDFVSERESMPYDVVIVGAGPAGLAAAIRLKQRADDAGRELSVCILAKGSAVGAHIPSGAVVAPKALDELLPDWPTMGCPRAERTPSGSAQAQ